MEEKKYLNLEMLALYDVLIKQFVNSQLFIGTVEQYEAANANNLIPLNALVIITDDDGTLLTSSLIGTGALDYMILG